MIRYFIYAIEALFIAYVITIRFMPEFGIIVSAGFLGCMIMVLETIEWQKAINKQIDDNHIFDIKKNQVAIDEIDETLKELAKSIQTHEDQLSATRAADGFKNLR